MKLHLISVYFKGARYSWFAYFPVGVKPRVTEADLARLGVRDNQTYAIGI